MASKTAEHLNLSKEQIAVLEDNFNKISKHPDGMTLMLIATECGLTEEETLVSTSDTHHEDWTSSGAAGNSDQFNVAEMKSRSCAFSRVRHNNLLRPRNDATHFKELISRRNIVLTSPCHEANRVVTFYQELPQKHQKENQNVVNLSIELGTTACTAKHQKWEQLNKKRVPAL